MQSIVNANIIRYEDRATQIMESPIWSEIEPHYKRYLAIGIKSKIALEMACEDQEIAETLKSDSLIL